jgi:hypothetical protein
MIRTSPKVIASIGISLILSAMIIGPFFSPPEFSWLRHSTSEQAGQHIAGAWIMRLGFVAFGSGTLSAALIDWRTRPLVRAGLVMFGLGLIGTAAWSNASILPGVSSDIREDWLHSVASGVVGTAFAAACAARLFVPGGARSSWIGWVGLVVAVAVPLAMGALPEFRGILQRAMFVVSFVFIVQEFRNSENRD